ncbi:zinc finger, CCHC-type, retrotransposon gag domain protein [Tanacetum coccineum]
MQKLREMDVAITRGDDVASVMTWEEFEDLVMEIYCPQGLMDKLEEEFLKLQQNDMKVLKYTTKFNEKQDLRNIRGPVQQARPATFEEAVELALMVEKENNCQPEEGDKKRKRENRDDDMKKIKISGEKMENASEYKLSTICKKTHRGTCWHEDSRNCGKPGHATKDCKVDWVYFRCKKPRHIISDCPERKAQES